jgi:hypothetical protein
MKTESKRHVSRRKRKGRYPPAFSQHMGNRLHTVNHDETGCRKVCTGKVSEYWTNKFHRAKETFGDECVRNYANCQSAYPVENR